MSTREAVLAAIYDLVVTACPNATVRRNEVKILDQQPGGYLNILDGTPGEPESDLSPMTYIYTHQIPVEVVGYRSGDQTAGEVIDALLSPIGRAVAVNRSLGGLCIYFSVSAVDVAEVTQDGTAVLPTAEFMFVAQYATQDPLN